MKTRTLSLFALTAMIVAVSCSPRVYSSKNKVADELPDGGSYTERIVPVVTKIAPDSQVTLRFYDDMPNVAYISAADFQSIVVPGSQMTVTHTGAGEYTLANGDATATVNINSDVFTSDQFEAFTNQMGLLQPGMANVYYDGMPFVRYKSVTYFPATATSTTTTPASTAKKSSPTCLSMRSASPRSTLITTSPSWPRPPVRPTWRSSTTRNCASAWTISTAIRDGSSTMTR